MISSEDELIKVEFQVDLGIDQYKQYENNEDEFEVKRPKLELSEIEENNFISQPPEKPLIVMQIQQELDSLPRCSGRLVRKEPHQEAGVLKLTSPSSSLFISVANRVNNHIITKQQPALEQFQCPMCSTIVTSIPSLWEHYQAEHKIAGKQLPTETTIRAGFTVKKPKKAAAANTKLLTCPRCPAASFKNPDKLVQHMNLLHVDYLMPPVQPSNTSLPTKSSLVIKCVLCRAKFQSQNDLTNHIIIQHSDPLQIHSYTCGICSNFQVFDNEAALVEHNRIFHPQSIHLSFIPKIPDKILTDHSRHSVYGGDDKHMNQAKKEVKTEKRGATFPYFCHFCNFHREFKFNSMIRGHINAYHKKCLQSIPCQECTLVCGSELQARFHGLSHTRFWTLLDNTERDVLEIQICYSQEIVVKCPLRSCKYLAPFTTLNDFEHHARSILHAGLQKLQNNQQNHQEETSLFVEEEAAEFKLENKESEIKLERGDEEDDEIEYLGVVGKDCDNGIFPDL